MAFFNTRKAAGHDDNFNLSFQGRESILKKLYEIGGGNTLPLGDLEKSAIRKLLHHSDSDIRERAVFVLGIHYKDYAILPLLVYMALKKERDQTVLASVYIALSSMVNRDKKILKITSEVLRASCLNENLDQELRGVAYRELRVLHGLLSAKDYSSFEVDVEINPPDCKWLESIN